MKVTMPLTLVQGKAKERNWQRQKNRVARAVHGKRGKLEVAKENLAWAGAAVSEETLKRICAED